MIPDLRSELLEAPPGHVVARGAHQDVEAVERIDEALYGGLVGHVELDRPSAPDGVADDTGIGQAVDDRRADTASATGDDGHLALERLSHRGRP